MDLKKLNEHLPDEAISSHPTKPYLSSIKAVYVTERFNEVFGIGKWQTRVEKEHVNHDTGMVVVKVIFTVPEIDIYYESFGGNDNGGSNSKNFDLGDAYKGATTDAITKIGSFLGVAIDVFKGKGSDENKQKTDDTPVIWLTGSQLEKAIYEKKIQQVLDYYNGSIKSDGNKYLMSKANKAKLLNALDKDK